MCRAVRDTGDRWCRTCPHENRHTVCCVSQPSQYTTHVYKMDRKLYASSKQLSRGPHRTVTHIWTAPTDVSAEQHDTKRADVLVNDQDQPGNLLMFPGNTHTGSCRCVCVCVCVWVCVCVSEWCHKEASVVHPAARTDPSEPDSDPSCCSYRRWINRIIKHDKSSLIADSGPVLMFSGSPAWSRVIKTLGLICQQEQSLSSVNTQRLSSLWVVQPPPPSCCLHPPPASALLLPPPSCSLHPPAEIGRASCRERV